ncbi:MAG: hypothetical protein RBU30_11485 [Polyangia bacterium]|jgi:hypothetical protein|nr:hypothetical protein [Polyangia bacterium]
MTAAMALGLGAALLSCVHPRIELGPDPDLEKKTVVRRSLIPGAGNGTFALVKIQKGEVIGEYGGVLLVEKDVPKNTAYLVRLPACAQVEGQRYHWLDGKGSRAHVTRVNFAPSRINGYETKLQNAQIAAVCRRPFIVFTASRDIQPGEEILTSYGTSYDYDPFMKLKNVQRYFCKRLDIDCSKKFTYVP